MPVHQVGRRARVSAADDQQDRDDHREDPQRPQDEQHLPRIGPGITPGSGNTPFSRGNREGALPTLGGFGVRHPVLDRRAAGPTVARASSPTRISVDARRGADEAPTAGAHAASPESEWPLYSISGAPRSHSENPEEQPNRRHPHDPDRSKKRPGAAIRIRTTPNPQVAAVARPSLRLL